MARFTTAGGDGSGAPGPQGPAGQDANTGDITFVNNTISSETGDDIVIQNKTNSDVVTAKLTLNQNYPRVAMEALDNQSNYFSGQWSSGTWSGNNIDFVDALDLINFFSNTPGNVTGISINNGPIVQWWGANFGEGTISLNVSGTPTSDPETVNEMIVYYTITSKIDIDYDNGSYDLIAKGMDINLESDDDIYITAGGDDLFLRANDDIRFTARYNDPNLSELQWTMNSDGELHFPADGYISNPINSSGDGFGNDTLHLVPDTDLTFEGGDQYIIIDPTAPNHIHIRAGGVQDASGADLFIGAERTNVNVSDSSGDVKVTSKRNDIINSYLNMNGESNSYLVTSSDSIVEPNAVVNVDGLDYAVTSVEYNNPVEGLKTVGITGGTFTAGNNYTFRVADGENQWTFDSDGTLYGPAEGLIQTPGLYSYDTLSIQSSTGPVNIGVDSSPGSVNITSYSGVTLNSVRTASYSDADKIVATLGDLIPGIQGEQGTQGVPGRGFRFVGEWNDIATYVIDDVVTFNGESYIAIQGSTVEYPPNTMYWTKIAAKGTDASTAGDSGWIPVGDLFNSFIAGSVTPEYRKLNGVVHMRGNMYQGTAGSVAFTLPEGFRPDYETVVLTQRFGTSTVTYVTVLANGEVVPHDDAAWLSGISFIVG